MVGAAADMVGNPIHILWRVPHPDRLYPGSFRATAPAPDERFRDALATQLTAAGKQVLDLLPAREHGWRARDVFHLRGSPWPGG